MSTTRSDHRLPNGGRDDRGVHADAPTDVPPSGWLDVLKRTKNEMRDDHSALSAAGVAYFAFLSLIPGLGALVSLYGLVADPEDVRKRVQSGFAALPADARRLLSAQLER